MNFLETIYWSTRLYILHAHSACYIGCVPLNDEDDMAVNVANDLHLVDSDVFSGCLIL
jgi:hypothetical protein